MNGWGGGANKVLQRMICQAKYDGCLAGIKPPLCKTEPFTLTCGIVTTHASQIYLKAIKSSIP